MLCLENLKMYVYYWYTLKHLSDICIPGESNRTFIYNLKKRHLPIHILGEAPKVIYILGICMLEM